MEEIKQTDVKVLQLESKLTVDCHGHVGVYLYVNNINLRTGPDLGNLTNIKVISPNLFPHPDSHELGMSVIVSPGSLQPQHGGELRDVVHHSEAGVSGPGDGGETPELAVSQLGKRGETYR